MKHANTSSARKSFQVLLESRALQAATMILPPGGCSSNEPEDEHPKAEQWLYVISGTGQAKPKAGRPIPLKPGSLLLIEKREPHQIKNTGRSRLVTLNLYAPPAYDKAGEVRPNVKA